MAVHKIYKKKTDFFTLSMIMFGRVKKPQNDLKMWKISYFFPHVFRTRLND